MLIDKVIKGQISYNAFRWIRENNLYTNRYYEKRKSNYLMYFEVTCLDDQFQDI